MSTSPRAKVVVAGAGVAGLEAVLALRALAADRVEIDWLAPDRHFAYRPLAVSEPFGLEPVRRFPLDRLAARHGVRLHHGALLGIEPDERVAFTEDGRELPYDFCLLATGARPTEAVAGALTFRGEQDVARMTDVLGELVAGRTRRVAFVAPAGVAWTLPLYELALMTGAAIQRAGADASAWLVTAEERPLELFGEDAGETVARLLAERGVGLRTRSLPESFAHGRLHMPYEGTVRVDAVVALARPAGRDLVGVPRDAAGFVPTDPDGQVQRLDRVYAAGDGTSFPVKQGGLAAQQADVAAATIAHRAGAPVAPGRFDPVLRGLLLTGGPPAYLRRGPEGGTDLAAEPLWWPPGKIVGRHLTAALASDLDLAEPVGPGALSIERPLGGLLRPEPQAALG